MRLAKKIGSLIVALTMGFGFTTNAFALGELKGETITAIVNPVGPPFAFVVDNVSMPQGIDVDLILELQRRLGFKLKEDRIYLDALGDGMQRVYDGRADIMGGGISYTVARTSDYDFSPIYYESSLALLYSTRHNPDITSVKDIKGKTIGMQQGATSAHYADRYGAKTVLFNNVILAYFQVAMGRMDGIIFDRPEVADFARVMPSLELSVTDDVFGSDECQFALLLTKDSKNRKAIALTMEEMFMDGTIDAIKAKWHAQ